MKRINQEGDKLVCDGLKILEQFEKTWTDQLADRRRRKFKLWSVKGLSRRRRALSPGAIRDLKTLVSSNELYNNGLRRNGEDSLNVNQVECMEVDRRKLVNEALEEVNKGEDQLRDEETGKFVSDNVVNISNRVSTRKQRFLYCLKG